MRAHFAALLERFDDGAFQAGETLDAFVDALREQPVFAQQLMAPRRVFALGATQLHAGAHEMGLRRLRAFELRGAARSDPAQAARSSIQWPSTRLVARSKAVKASRSAE